MPRNARAETDYDFGTRTPLARQPEPEAERVPAQFGERYRVQALLGRGGMAAVYSAEDLSNGRVLAIKHSTHRPDTLEGRELCALFEREFHLLAQLSHPRVIEVYDYGMEAGRPFYTMELLDGGDLRELSPLPWRRACALIHDVCSSLALLHSRRFVHRDVGPRNVRCTRAGFAKLIDFGAAVPMGVAPQIVGTPPFVPPEALNRFALDARADLFSLGATLYFALTGEQAYPATELAQLSAVWANKPYAPSELAPEIPPALDELVLALISLQPAQRPRSAFEVMQRLSAIAELPSSESQAVPQAYLSAPITVGRAAELDALRAQLMAAEMRLGSATLLAAPSGGGRTHMLDACALTGKTLGATVLRAGADAHGYAFSAAQTMLVQLLERAPAGTLALAQREGVAELLFEDAAPRDLRHTRQPDQLRAALERLLWAVSEESPVLIAVDDVHDLDEASLTLLTALAQTCKTRRAMLLLAADSGAPARASAALQVLESYCARLPLAPLDAQASAALIGSLFGDVPNVALVSHQIHQVAQGNPRATLRLAQWLVEQGTIRYESGGWTLPEQLSAADLPQSGEAALLAQVQKLSPPARELIECQASAIKRVFTREHYLQLLGNAGPGAVDRALLELVSAGLLASDGRAYTLNRGLVSLLSAAGTPEEQTRRHAALAQLFSAPGTPSVVAIPHLLAAGEMERALERLQQFFREEDAQSPELALEYELPLSPETLASLYLDGLKLAQARGSSPLEIGEIRRRLVLVSVIAGQAYYWIAAPAWLEQLSRDSGLAHYRALPAELPPLERLGQAYNAALQTHQALPEAERGYAPDAAIRCLVQYVVMSIAIAARTLDRELITSLPPLLEPFAPIAPTVHAIWQNACATCDNQAARVLRARSRWQGVHEQLAQHVGELPFVTSIRNAIAFGIGTIEAALGVEGAERWAEQIDGDPLHRVNAMYLRKIVALLQGDWERADAARKRAELISVHASTQQLLTTLLPTELAAHALAGDLAGVKHVAERIARIAEHSPRWRALAQVAHAQFQRLRGDPAQAREALEASLAETDPRGGAGDLATLLAFCPAAALYVEVLVELGEHARALAWGKAALAKLHELEIDAAAWELERALALAEARHPEEMASAAARLEALIASQRELGVRGLHLGASYEARARVAIAAGDSLAVAEYAQLTAAEYRHGLGSLLGARYERLRDEAWRAGIVLRA